MYGFLNNIQTRVKKKKKKEQKKKKKTNINVKPEPDEMYLVTRREPHETMHVRLGEKKKRKISFTFITIPYRAR